MVASRLSEVPHWRVLLIEAGLYSHKSKTNPQLSAKSFSIHQKIKAKTSEDKVSKARLDFWKDLFCS